MALLTQPAKDETRRSAPGAYWLGRIFVATWVGYAGFYFCRRNIPWTPLPATGHAGHAANWMSSLAYLLLVFSAGYTAGGFVGGWAADRFGSRKTLVFGGLLSFISTALLVTHAPVGVLILLELLNGFGQGFGWPALVKLFSVWMPRRQLAVGLAWWSTSYALGSFLANALATGLSTMDTFSISTGSRLSILIPSFLMLGTTLFFYMRVRNRPLDAGLPDTQQPVSNDGSGWRDVLRNPEIQLLAAFYFFLKLTRYALLFWLPLYIIETQQTHGSSALTLSSLFELTGFLGALAASYASERWFGARRYPVGAIMLFLAAFVFLLHPLVSAAGAVATGISISLIGVLIFGPDVLMSTIAVIEAVPVAQAGRAGGYVNAVGSLGQMISPVLVAFLSHMFGWNSVFTLFVVCSLIAAVLLATRWSGSRAGEGLAAQYT